MLEREYSSIQQDQPSLKQEGGGGKKKKGGGLIINLFNEKKKFEKKINYFIFII